MTRLLQRPPFQDLLPSIGHSAEPLSIASSVASRYLSNDVDKRVQWYRNEPISIWAAACGHTSVVRCLLDDKVSFEEDWQGSTALNQAVAFGHDETLRLLLQRGFHPRDGTTRGSQALYQASDNGQEKAPATLLEHGADIEGDKVRE